MKDQKKTNSKKFFNTLIALCLLANLFFLICITKNLAARNQKRKEILTLEKQLDVLLKTKSTEALHASPETNQQKREEERDTVTEETSSKETDPAETTSVSSILDTLSAAFLEEAEASGEIWSVSLKDLSNGAETGYHPDRTMQSASVIKVFIMATIYSEVCYPQKGLESLYFPEQYEGELRDLLVNMITVSDNIAANRLVEGLGNGSFEAGASIVNTFCREHGYTNTSLGRRFLAENSSGDNYTSAGDCCRILSDIYHGICVCPEASKKMLDLLKSQTRTEKIPSGLPDGIISANKTGEMPEGYGLGCIENDIAIVFGENTDYILCILSNNLSGNNEGAKERIRKISFQVYSCLTPHLVQNAATIGI